MKWLTLATAAALSASGAMTLAAQQPAPAGPPMAAPGARGRGGAIDDPAQFLLAHTGEFNLTDAQVTKLAAIARRSADRRRAVLAQMDSMRPQRTPGGTRPDSAARAQMRQQMSQRMEQMRPQLQKLRDQAQADRRDAIALLTPDQQAKAWERIATSSRMGGFGGRMGFGGMHRGYGRGFGQGFGPGGARTRGAPAPGARRRAPGNGGSPNAQRRPDDTGQDQ